MGSWKLIAAACAAVFLAPITARIVSAHPTLSPDTARPDKKMRQFVYLGQHELKQNLPILDRPDIAGAQVMYVWMNLEPTKDDYDFSMIEEDLALTKSRGKKLYIEVLDRFFQPQARYLPKYMLDDPRYGGGLVPQVEDKMSGWAARQWDPAVRRRFQKLVQALAKRFDGRIAGLILTETAIAVEKVRPKDFDCDAYFEATKENALAARRAFTRSYVVQYANFWPCEFSNSRGYMSNFFDFAAAKGIGVGGPDVVPWAKGQMLASYAFIRVYRNKVPVVAMAVQEPTLQYINPETGKPFTRREFERFALVYLGVDDLFWSKDAPWLKEDSPAGPGPLPVNLTDTQTAKSLIGLDAAFKSCAGQLNRFSSLAKFDSVRTCLKQAPDADCDSRFAPSYRLVAAAPAVVPEWLNLRPAAAALAKSCSVTPVESPVSSQDISRSPVTYVFWEYSHGLRPKQERPHGLMASPDLMLSAANLYLEYVCLSPELSAAEKALCSAAFERNFLSRQNGISGHLNN